MQRGDHLISPRIGYTHHGLYLGQQRVIHYVQDGVAVVTLDTFQQGQPCSVRHHLCRRFDAGQSIARAFKRQGEDGYNVLFNNCEHFVHWCIEGTHDSQQVSQLVSTSLAASQAARLAASTVGQQAGKHTVQLAAQAATAAVTGSQVAGSTTALATGLAAGVTATTLAPLALTMATSAVVGYGVGKLLGWMLDD